MRILPAGSRFSTWRCLRILSIAVLTVAFALQFTSSASARPSAVLEEVSHDPFTNPGYEHRSEVEPDVVAHGRTAVATYQVGRAAEGGSVAIGVAVSTDDGRSWSDRILPGSAEAAGGRYQRASDPSVSYGAGGNGWLVGFLGLNAHRALPDPTPLRRLGCSVGGRQVVRRLPSWSRERPAASSSTSHGSPATTTARALTSAGATPCGTNWVCISVAQTRSSWRPRHVTAAGTGALPFEPPTRRLGSGVIPLVRPDGSVTVVYLNTQHPFHPAIAAFATLDGGRSWGGSSTISKVRRSPRELPGPRSRVPVRGDRGRRHDLRRLVRLSLRTVMRSG